MHNVFIASLSHPDNRIHSLMIFILYDKLHEQLGYVVFSYFFLVNNTGLLNSKFMEQTLWSKNHLIG